ncbi:MAG: SGNH/GDSL hydrolase family protein [Bacteroidota bacterium]
MFKHSLTLFASLFILMCCQAQHTPVYMPLGDSYTIGEGLKANERFPDQLVELLARDSRKVVLGPNPSQTGWTSLQLIEEELPLFHKTKPEYATLLIGVNDWVQGVPAGDFRKQFRTIVKDIIQVLPAKKNLVVLTIPDFSATPEGAKYGRGRNISAGIDEFNRIIIEECNALGITVVDICPETRKMKSDPSLISADGLHPSAKEYAIWAKMVLPYFQKMN